MESAYVYVYIYKYTAINAFKPYSTLQSVAIQLQVNNKRVKLPSQYVLFVYFLVFL